MCSGESGGVFVFVTKMWGSPKEFQLFFMCFHFRLRRKECLGPYFGTLHIHATNEAVVRPLARVSRSCIALHDQPPKRIWWYCKYTKSQRR